MQKFDVLVFGAGMVGASAALGLARQGKKVAVIEPNLPSTALSEQPDMRVSAISLGTQRFIESLGAWQYLKEHRLNPYNQLSVWEDNHTHTSFEADLIGETRLGTILENRHLQCALLEALKQYPSVSWYCDAELVDPNTGAVRCDGEDIVAQLIVVAEGAQSKTRQQLGIGTSGWQYQQQVLAVSITLPDDSGSHTWQRFMPTGPKGFLPLFGHFASLVWYGDKTELSMLSGLSHNELKGRLIQTFDGLSMDMHIDAKAMFPISRMHAKQYGRGRALLVGDAAHTINPLAGQGANLGFKDVECLLSILQNNQELLGSVDTLIKSYERKRRPDNLLMMSMMDGFYATFSNDNLFLKHARNTGLAIAQKMPFAKQQVLKYATGLAKAPSEFLL